MATMSSPEPMALGSPSQSPQPNQYLPQFLLGDLVSSNPNSQMNRGNPAQSGSRYWTNGNSPPRNTMGSNYQSNIPNSGGVASSLSRNYTFNGYDTKSFNSNHYLDKNEPNFHGYHHSNAQNYSPHYGHHADRTIGSTTILGGNIGSNVNTGLERNAQSVPGAPPVNRLVDLMNKPTFSPISNVQTPTDTTRHKLVYEGYSLEKTSQEQSFNNQHRLSPPSPSQIDPFYTFGESIKVDEKLDDTWITVYGFPPSATSYVLQEFSLYGQIIKHISSSQGNWMHIQYQTKLQAQKALSKSGKILANSLMIGVMPCIDKKVMESGNSVNRNSGDLASPPTSPLSSSSKLYNKTLSNNQNGVKLDRTQSLRTNVRPLSTINRNLDAGAATTDSIGTSGSNKLPKKNTNVISKAMEYMFGW